MSIHRWIDKAHLVYPYDYYSAMVTTITIIINQPTDAYSNIDESQNNYTKWKKPDIKGEIFYDSPYMRYLE